MPEAGFAVRDRGADPHEVVLIATDRIDISDGHRAAKPETVAEIAASIEKFGVLQAIGVVATEPGEPSGGYTLVFGRHRLEATRSLGISAIPARVLDLDPDDAEAVMHSENLHRNELDKVGRLNAVAHYNAWHKAKYPQHVGKESGRVNGTRDKAKAASPPPEAAPESSWSPGAHEGPPAPKEEKKPSRRRSEEIAEKLGISATHAKQDIRIVEGLDEPQRKVLVDRGLTLKEMAKVAKVADAEHKSRVVNLVASGMDFDTAMAAGQAPATAVVEIVANHPTAPAVDEASLTDDEWVYFFCSDALERIKHHAYYFADAIFYRKARKALADLKGKLKAPISQSKSGPGARGIFRQLVSKVLNIAHPKDWPACGPCGGSGMAGDRSECPKCGGRGYAIITDASR